jgi:hypothetical protein
MPSPAAKLSVSVPRQLATEVRRRVGARGLSGFVARALAHELERQQLKEFLDELETLHGPVPKSLALEAKRAWAKH